MNTRTVIATLIGLALVVPLAACSSDPAQGFCPDLAGDSLTIIKDTTENATTTVPAEVECLVTQAIMDDKPISVISADGIPEVTLANWHAPVRRGNSDVFNDDLPGAFMTLRESFVVANDPGLDLLKAFSLASDLGQNSTVVVLSSGLQDTAPLNFPRQGMLAADPAQVADDVVQTGALTSAGSIGDVLWIGAGYGVNEQPSLTDREIDRVRQIWTAVLGEVGITPLDFVGTPPSGASAVATDVDMTPTPSEPIADTSFPPVAPEVPKEEAVFSYDGSTSVAFLKDSAVYVDAAAAEDDLALLAEYIIDVDSCAITITGTTAEVNGFTHEQGRPLALSRANAVSATLASFGIDPACMTTAGYAGSESPWYTDNYSGGVFDTAAAAVNRAVHVSVG